MAIEAIVGPEVLIVAGATMLAATAAFSQSPATYGVEGARAHATGYGDPDYYTQPAFVDVYQDTFLGRPTSQTDPYYNTVDATVAAERQTAACYAGNCSPAPPGRAEVCASAYHGSFQKLGVGDTIYFGTVGIDAQPSGNTPDATRTKTHTIVEVLPGTGAGDCAVGTWILTVHPWIDYVAEGVTNGIWLSPMWRDGRHPTLGPRT